MEDEWSRSAQVWMDNQPVYFMTTLHRPVHEIDNHKIRTLGKEKVKRMALTFLALLLFQIIAIWVGLITTIRL